MEAVLGFPFYSDQIFTDLWSDDQMMRTEWIEDGSQRRLSPTGSPQTSLETDEAQTTREYHARSQLMIKTQKWIRHDWNWCWLCVQVRKSRIKILGASRRNPEPPSQRIYGTSWPRKLINCFQYYRSQKYFCQPTLSLLVAPLFTLSSQNWFLQMISCVVSTISSDLAWSANKWFREVQ